MIIYLIFYFFIRRVLKIIKVKTYVWVYFGSKAFKILHYYIIIVKEEKSQFF
mgnify:CR=1 FL=1|jgi:hypothetical protein